MAMQLKWLSSNLSNLELEKQELRFLLFLRSEKSLCIIVLCKIHKSASMLKDIYSSSQIYTITLGGQDNAFLYSGY